MTGSFNTLNEHIVHKDETFSQMIAQNRQELRDHQKECVDDKKERREDMRRLTDLMVNANNRPTRTSQT